MSNKCFIGMFTLKLSTELQNWSVIECPFTYGHSIIGPYGPIIDDDFLVITDYAV